MAKNIQNNTINSGRVWVVPHLCELYPGICLTTEKKAWENLSQGRKNLSRVEKPQLGVTACYNSKFLQWTGTVNCHLQGI